MSNEWHNVKWRRHGGVDHDLIEACELEPITGDIAAGEIAAAEQVPVNGDLAAGDIATAGQVPVNGDLASGEVATADHMHVPVEPAEPRPSMFHVFRMK